MANEPELFIESQKFFKGNFASLINLFNTSWRKYQSKACLNNIFSFCFNRASDRKFSGKGRVALSITRLFRGLHKINIFLLVKLLRNFEKIPKCLDFSAKAQNIDHTFLFCIIILNDLKVTVP